MTTKTFYLKNAVASGSNFLSLQDGGSAPAVATTVTGWTVGTVAAGNWSLMAAGVKRAAATFGGSALPSAGPNNTLGDCFRSENPITASFSNAAIDRWTGTFNVVASVSGGDQDGHLAFHLWKGLAADGSDATNLFSTHPTDETNDVVDLDTSADQVAGLSAIVDLVANPIVFNNEYLFLQVAWKITDPGGSSARDVLLRVGHSPFTGLTSGLVTPDVVGAHPVTKITQARHGIFGRRYGSFAGKRGIYTAGAALSIKGATLSASSTFSPGTHTAAATLSIVHATLAASSTFAPGTHTAFAALHTGPTTLAASATFAAGTHAATATLSIAHATLAASALFAAGVYQAMGVLTIKGATLSASNQFTAGTHTLVGTLTAAPTVIASTATMRPGTHLATAALSIPPTALAASATFVFIVVPTLVGRLSNVSYLDSHTEQRYIDAQTESRYIDA